jgi:CHAT domain-containing protein
LTRPWDRHLDNDELDALIASRASGVVRSGRISKQAAEDARRHVESCQDCERRVRMHSSVQSELEWRRTDAGKTPGKGCVDESQWVRVVAGLLPERETRELMQHAAQCGHCGPLLRDAAEALDETPTTADETVLAHLNNAQPGWQTQMAERLRETSRLSPVAESRVPPSGRLFRRRVFALAAVAALLVTAGWFIMRAFGTASPEQLLAESYTERRTIEARIPGAKYAPLRVERGAETSDLRKPASLLKAEAEIAENLQKYPNDPRWLQASARADLLDGHYDSAIKGISQALGAQADSPSLLADLGTAYFLRAQSLERPVDYGNAIESLSKALRKTPDDPVALFNRALASQAMFFYTQAQEDWEHYLRVDPHGDWADEVRKRLEEVKAKQKVREQSIAQPLAPPSNVAAADATLQAAIGDRIEDYMKVGVSEWLPQAYPLEEGNAKNGEEARAALRVLADIAAARHGDLWLRDLLTEASSRDFPRAVKDLSEAIQANETAETAKADSAAKEAASLFLTAGSPAGELRARLETLTALNIAQDGQRCAEAGKKLLQDVEDRRYPWLRIQLNIETGSCAWLNENLGESRRRYLAALSEAGDTGFQQIGLRAQNHFSGLLAASGDFGGAWKIARSGLATFWSGSYPDVRGYNFYYDLYEASRVEDLPHAQIAAWQDGLRLGEVSPDLAQRAMAHAAMGSAAEKAEMPQLAEKEFARASELFVASPQIESTRVAQLEAETRLAGVEVQRGNAEHAVQRLKPLQSEVDALSDNFLAILFSTDLGEAEASLGDWDSGERDLHKAVALAERRVSTVADDKSRLEIARQSSAAYRALVQRQLRKGDAEGAFDLWERYRGISLSASSLQSSRLAAPVTGELVHMTSFTPSLTNATVISYAVLPQGMAVWIADNRGIGASWAEGQSIAITKVATRFRELCADPRSNQADLARTARSLYDLLILPIREHLVADRMLVVEPDDVLAGVPFEALADENGHFLGEKTPILTSLGMYSWVASRAVRPITEDAPTLIAAVPRSDADLSSQLLPDAIPEAQNVARYFRRRNLIESDAATEQQILAHLASAAVFHFAGHAISTSQQTGILASDALLPASVFKRSLLAQMQLAVFSACETQDGSTGGFNDADSLVRVFLQAGVPHVLASRWNVDSAATRQFMDVFYRSLLSGDSVPLAVHRSQQALRSQSVTSHPYYWSAFNAFGVS